jgi:hypothetical protein
MIIFRRIWILCPAAIQQPVAGMGEPVIKHGTAVPIVDGGRLFVVGIEKLGAGTAIGGLTPALLISTEPSGIPAPGVPPGDGGDTKVAADEAALPEVALHVAEFASDGVPMPIPPPS